LETLSRGISLSIRQLVCCLQSITVEMLPDVMGQTPYIWHCSWDRQEKWSYRLTTNLLKVII